MLSGYNKDVIEPICRLKDCEGCKEDCVAKYRRTCYEYDQEGKLTAQELSHLRSIVNE